MSNNLDKPLGTDRPAREHRRGGLSVTPILAGAAVVSILGLSVYSLQGEPALKQPSAAANAGAAQSPEAGDSLPPAGPPPTGMPRSAPQSGAHLERSLNEDGSVVTKYTPRPRQEPGAVLIGAQPIGQDPRVADRPNPALMENTPQGRLPVIGPDGLRPMDHYARPWSGARGTRIAIVVSGLGLSQTGTQRAIRQLPPSVTLAFAASGNSLQRWMQEARRAGFEILLQVPLEPFDYPANDPGPGTLLIGDGPKRNLERLHTAMGRITNYTGIMGYLGGRFLADAAALEPVLRDIGKRGLLFLDDGTSARSSTAPVAGAIELPHAFGDLTLDGQLQADAILKKLDELERIALRRGSAIGIASAFDESVDAIRKWGEEASQRGIEIVAVSALAAESVSP